MITYLLPLLIGYTGGKLVADERGGAVCVAAIDGMNVAKEGIQAMIDARYPGKILIFRQLEDLPLLGWMNWPKNCPMWPKLSVKAIPGILPPSRRCLRRLTSRRHN